MLLACYTMLYTPCIYATDFVESKISETNCKVFILNGLLSVVMDNDTNKIEMFRPNSDTDAQVHGLIEYTSYVSHKIIYTTYFIFYIIIIQKYVQISTYRCAESPSISIK